MSTQSRILTLALIIGSGIPPAFAQSTGKPSSNAESSVTTAAVDEHGLTPDEQKKREKAVWLQNFIADNAGKLEIGAMLLKYPESQAEFVKLAGVKNPEALAALLTLQYESLVKITETGTNNIPDGGKSELTLIKGKIDAVNCHADIPIKEWPHVNQNFDELAYAALSAIIYLSQGRLSPEVEITGVNFLTPIQTYSQAQLVKPVLDYFVKHAGATGDKADTIRMYTEETASNLVSTTYIEWAELTGMFEEGLKGNMDLLRAASSYESDRAKLLEAAQKVAYDIMEGDMPGVLKAEFRPNQPLGLTVYLP